jgi:uncharacterized protein YjbI with pentapeptide repeats
VRKFLVWSCLVIAAVAVATALLYAVFWPLSDLIARHDVGAISGPNRAAALQTARDAARGRLVAFGAGLFAAGALIYTARNFSLSRQGQVTDRYTKAIEQLGPDKGLDVRIGGIYALERITRDSPRDHPTIMEVLAAFIREHSREQWPLAGLGADPPDHTTRPDVQAAATVIGRRIIRHDRQPINLNAADLTGADLDGANLDGANLDGANLTGAHLTGANLDGANLTGAHLTGAHLTKADLAGAYISRADLTKADLAEAHLTGAHLTGAHLTGAHLYYADLTKADLAEADLTKADLTHANLTKADLTHANLTGAKLYFTSLTEAKLANPYMPSPAETGANLTDADFLAADLTGAVWPSVPEAPSGWQREGGRLRRAATRSSDAATE